MKLGGARLRVALGRGRDERPHVQVHTHTCTHMLHVSMRSMYVHVWICNL